MSDGQEASILREYAGVLRREEEYQRRVEEYQHLSQSLEEYTLQRFAFLKKFGFTQRTSKRVMSIIYTDIIFRGPIIGIHIQLYYHQRRVFVELIRPENGKYPQSFKIDGRYRYLRIERAIAQHTSANDPLLTELDHIHAESEAPERDTEFLQHMLDLYAQLLETHLPTLLTIPEKTLFPEHGPSTHMRSQRDTLKKFINERFVFLQQKGFTAKPKVRRDTWVYDITFRSKTIGVMISLDFFDCYISTALMKLVDGKLRDDGILIWDEGIRLEQNIETLIPDTLKQEDPRLGTIRRLMTNTIDADCDLHFAQRLLDLQAQLLETYIDAIMQRPFDIIFPRQHPTGGVAGLDFR